MLLSLIPILHQCNHFAVFKMVIYHSVWGKSGSISRKAVVSTFICVGLSDISAIRVVILYFLLAP